MQHNQYWFWSFGFDIDGNGFEILQKNWFRKNKSTRCSTIKLIIVVPFKWTFDTGLHKELFSFNLVNRKRFLRNDFSTIIGMNQSFLYIFWRNFVDYVLTASQCHFFTLNVFLLEIYEANMNPFVPFLITISIRLYIWL